MKLIERAKAPVFLIVGLCLFIVAPSHAEAAKDCTASLSEMSWALRDADRLSHLNSDKAGQKLHGVICREAAIVAWFEENSWTHLRTVSPDGEGFGSGSLSYQADRGLVFCLPRRFLFRWLTNGCSAQASVLLFERRITKLIAGPTK